MENFGQLFKKYRLRSNFFSLAEFGEALSKNGFVFEDSLFSRWQKGNRIPKDRLLLVKIIDIFIQREGIHSISEANKFLESAGLGYMTEIELAHIKSPFMPLQLQQSKKTVDFMEMIGKSKLIPRTGWVMNDIKNPESVAEHSFRVSVLAMVLADHLGADREKLIQMALLHDLGEVITGDLVWSRGALIDKKKRAEKEEMEKNGIENIIKLIGLSAEYKKLFEEMMERRSLEAITFWQLDKLEMAIQALEYEKKLGKNLEEFFISAEVQMNNPFIKKIMKQILKQRPVFKKVK